MVESSSCVSTNLVSWLHWRRKRLQVCVNTTSVCSYVNLSVYSFPPHKFFSAPNVHTFFMKSPWLHCDHHFQSSYILLVSAWVHEATDSGQRTHGGMPLKNFKKTSQTSLARRLCDLSFYSET